MALWTEGEDVCLAIHFELWQYCTTVFAALSRGGAWSFAPNFRP